jgi:hypothetical protein
MNSDVADTTEDYHVLVFVVTIVTDDTLSILLCPNGPRSNFMSDWLGLDWCLSAFIFFLLRLENFQNVEVLVIIFSLLGVLHMLQKLPLHTRWIPYIDENFVVASGM